MFQNLNQIYNLITAPVNKDLNRLLLDRYHSKDTYMQNDYTPGLTPGSQCPGATVYLGLGL